MNYKKLHDDIITNAVADYRSKHKNSLYYENHHIIPKSMGGTNDKSNMVLLTAKEHFIIHHLLTKFTTGEAKGKLIHAFWGMCNQLKGNNKRDYKITAVVYQTVKELNAVIISESMTGKKSHRWGKKHSDETKARMCIAATGELHHSFKGYYITPWGKFPSSIIASKHPDSKLSNTSILQWCKNNKTIITEHRYFQNMILLTIDDIGKSLMEVGFCFLQIDK